MRQRYSKNLIATLCVYVFVCTHAHACGKVGCVPDQPVTVKHDLTATLSMFQALQVRQQDVVGGGTVGVGEQEKW